MLCRCRQVPWLRNVSIAARALSFPCLDLLDSRSAALSHGPDPAYSVPMGYNLYLHDSPVQLDYGGSLPSLKVAYETWGSLNSTASNAILLHTGLSASSHAKSHDKNKSPGWWEKFIGPGKALDTNHFFVICTNVLGGCFGSTGPSSINPLDGKPYATKFPIISLNDMVRRQFELLDFLGIQKLFASVGSSMGGMQSLAAGVMNPSRVGRIISISGCAKSHPYILMADPNFNRGFYYDGIPPHVGMKLAREIATITYRSGPEWENRFGRRRSQNTPALCPDFAIEEYLDHQGEKWCLEYDANSLLYISKAMDLFDLSESNMSSLKRNVERNTYLPPEQTTISPQIDLANGLKPLVDHDILVLGVQSDILFPAWQQTEIVQGLHDAGNTTTKHIELGEDVSLFGHDSFLLLEKEVGAPVKKYLEN
ncbi:putative serine-O-acetyltransferase cys2 [Neolecta irregularis DAH-3]|uniref:Putative serine-O-acetyltransferase cys2 n=1 Tax=Neolecta irregularis (strain DAH-3) TaxID=1198029 RepID=A0A1U7LNZ2_NEOID|nr:putative serine-O-acetyltransferase cys2 [Neolecta irregularis DAH-3]|eukprot:OLL24348.1 putative serine-O-acetyltransferase cys2 [Neolecta irregularis DAH-3]